MATLPQTTLDFNRQIKLSHDGGALSSDTGELLFAADPLTKDPVFTQVVGTDALASQPSLSRLFPRFDHASMEQLNQANQELLDKVHQYRDSKSIILDLDSTHADTYGDQENATFNAHYGTDFILWLPLMVSQVIF